MTTSDAGSRDAGLVPVAIVVNGRERRERVEPRLLLVDLLRTRLGLTGTHVGCDTTSCGACTVLFDGRAVKSCTMFAVEADGHEVLTVEGLSEGEDLHPLQQAFRECHALQCGFCTPGMLMIAAELLAERAAPGEAEIRRHISGNICRCTGYHNIVKAIAQAAESWRPLPGAGR